MDKLSAGFDLGTALRTHRKMAGLIQLDLAKKASLAERTVRGLIDSTMPSATACRARSWLDQ